MLPIRFRKHLTFLKNNLFPSNQVIGLEIRGEDLKLLQLKAGSNGNIEMYRFLQIPLAGKGPEAIDKILREHRINSGKIVVSIPRHLVVQKYLTLPSIDPAEIERMMPFQIQDLTPYPKNEIVYDYQIISSEVNGYSKLLVILAHNKVIEELISPLEALGLTPDIIHLSSAALANWFLATRKEEEAFDKISVLVNLDNEDLDIAYLQNKKLIFSRGVKLKGIITSEETADQILWELKQGLAILNQELEPKELGKIIFTGPGILPDTAKFLEEDLSVPVERAALLSGITLNETLSKKREELEKDTSLIRLLGLGLGGIVSSPVIFNLLPFPIKKEREVFLKNQVIFKNVVLAVTVFFLLLANFSFKIYKRAREVRVIKNKIHRIEPLAKQIDNERKSLLLIKEEQNPGPSSLDVLEELYKITPETVVLSNFDFEIGKVVILRGQAQELSQVFDYVTTLEKSSCLRNIKVNYANRRRTGENEAINFEFYCQISSGTKERKVE